MPKVYKTCRLTDASNHAFEVYSIGRQSREKARQADVYYTLYLKNWKEGGLTKKQFSYWKKMHKIMHRNGLELKWFKKMENE